MMSSEAVRLHSFHKYMNALKVEKKRGDIYVRTLYDIWGGEGLEISAEELALMSCCLLPKNISLLLGYYAMHRG